MTPKELYFVRHGQTEWNAIARMQGQWNSDLSDQGRAQAEVNGRFLKSRTIEHLVASPLDRTRQTAEIINQHLGLGLTFDDRLMEWNSGDWSGYLYAELPDHWPEEWAAWRADPFHYRGPNCENYPDMIDRSKPFLDEILKAPQTHIAIVSHGMIGRAMLGTVLGLTPAEILDIHQSNDTIFHVSITEAGTTVCHYTGGTGPNGGFPGQD